MTETTNIRIEGHRLGSYRKLRARAKGVLVAGFRIRRLTHDLVYEIGLLAIAEAIKNPGSAVTVPGQAPSPSPRSKERMT